MNKFPDDFYWGASTSAHQVEGNNHNNWSAWEEENADRLSQVAKSSPPKGGWPDYVLNRYPSPLQRENYVSGLACDHYNRYEEDFDLAKKLGHNAHRFSIEWSRIEPEKGVWNEEEIEHYRKVIISLRSRGIEPFVTLWHWTMPLWLSEKGGAKSKNFSIYFSKFAEKMSIEYPEIRFWITLNEPLAHAKLSYLISRWPPQERNIYSFLKVSRNLVQAHKLAYRTIKRKNPETQIGISHNMSCFEIKHKTLLNLAVKNFGEWRKNFAFLNSISKHQDFIGFNYYSHYIVNRGIRKIETKEVSDMNWSIYPKGIYDMLLNLRRYKKPIYITENGLADAEDSKRSQFIREHLKYAKRAIDEGVDLRGYFHWSLLDNFEWSDGFWPRFGLVEMDYKTMKRKIRPSALTYKNVIQNGY